MSKPLVSIIIPTFNGKDHLGEAIRSVLDQTYDNFEIIVVDDVSPEDMLTIVNGFNDSRIKYIRHDRNRGAVAARKTGVHASSGEIIAFLDQDDLFHKEKLEAHVNFLIKNPEIGLSYNGRFEVLGPEKIVCGIYNPPENLHLADWVLGYPVSPSDAVLRREWALSDEIWDDSFSQQAEHVIFNGQEIVFGGRLTLAGCKFGHVNRALNFRRYHPYRVLKYIAERCHSELACQKIIFNDPRCPEDVKALQNIAFANIYLMWSYVSYIQEEYDMGRKFLKQVIQLTPLFFQDGDKCMFLDAWVSWIAAGTVDHVRRFDVIVYSIFKNLPGELEYLQRRQDWAIATGHMLKGLHTLLWGMEEEAEIHIRLALEKGANIDSFAMNMLSDGLLSYERELDPLKGKHVIESLAQILSRLNKPESVKFVKGFYFINRAFRNYHDGKYEEVTKDALAAIKAHPEYLFSRGVLSVLFHSLLWRLNPKTRRKQIVVA